MEMNIAYPVMLFDRNLTDGRAMMCSVLTLHWRQPGHGRVEYGKIYDIYFPRPGCACHVAERMADPCLA
eukprot:770040-Lingulodinium_polyedra.AAC.1